MSLSDQIDKANTLIDTCDKKIKEENKKESEFDPAEIPGTLPHQYRCYDCGELGHAMREHPNENYKSISNEDYNNIIEQF